MKTRLEDGAGLVGRQLGPYRILDVIGPGSTGTVVFRAARLPQSGTVALKVLSLQSLRSLLPQSSDGSALVERFRHTARHALLLAHPNIVRTYDVDEAEGMAYIAMEYIDGGSLADRLRTGPVVRPAEAARWIAQLGSALDYAHDRGLVHRDVKPDNVLLELPTAREPMGRVVLTDFGIAHVVGRDQSLQGLVVGTPAYMSPEQAQGRPASPYSDVYSLAVVAYELLSGRTPFVGETLALLHSHIYDPPPPIRRFNARLSRKTERVLARALAKAPDRRHPSAGTFARELGASLGTRPNPRVGPDEPTATRGRPAPRTQPRFRSGPVYAIVLLLMAAGGLVLLYWSLLNGAPSPPPPPPPAMPPGVLAFVRGVDPNRDGSIDLDERTDICLFDLSSGALTYLTQGSDYKSAPAWSPDGRRLAFAWNRNGNMDLYLMAADGSDVQRLTDHLALDSGPVWDPSDADVGRILFDSERALEDPVSAASPSQEQQRSAIYLLDLRTGLTARLTDPQNRDGDPAWSPDGRSIAFNSHRDGDLAVYVMRSDGSEPRRLSSPALALDMMPSWSPDGQTIAFSRGDPRTSAVLYVVATDGTGEARISTGEPAACCPAWSPDGQWIAFSRHSSTGIGWDLCVMRADGGDVRCVLQDGNANLYPAWKP